MESDSKISTVPPQVPTEVIIITGLSGAGKTTALNALEDLGYFCVDNLPPPVVPATLTSLFTAGFSRIGLGMDARARVFLSEAPTIVEALSIDPSFSLKVIYLDSSEELLARRFSATRRPHPLATDGSGAARAVLDGIREERRALTALRGLASLVIDSSELSVHDLRRAVITSVTQGDPVALAPCVRVVSFGFKYGAPRDADLLFDVRFLPNPYFVEELKPHSGLDRAVADYVLETEDAKGLLNHILPLLTYCLPRYQEEGKSYVTIAVGCTGGRHRSVALSTRIALELTRALGISVDAVHRDLNAGEYGAESRPVDE